MKRLLLSIAVFTSFFSIPKVFAQSVTINPASNSTGIIDVNSTIKGVLAPRMTEAERNNMVSPLVGMIVYCTNCTTGAGTYSYNGTSWIPMFVPPSTPTTPTYTIGQLAQGGVVFYVDESGRHGLVAATTDQSTNVKWFSGNFTKTKAYRFGFYGGEDNTKRIIDNQNGENYAALVAAQYNGGGFGDWYLPSKDELQEMYVRRTTIGGFASDSYWSSTEIVVDEGEAALLVANQNFSTGIQSNNNKSLTGRVRAIRRF